MFLCRLAHPLEIHHRQVFLNVYRSNACVQQMSSGHQRAHWVNFIQQDIRKRIILYLPQPKVRYYGLNVSPFCGSIIKNNILQFRGTFQIVHWYTCICNCSQVNVCILLLFSLYWYRAVCHPAIIEGQKQNLYSF